MTCGKAFRNRQSCSCPRRSPGSDYDRVLICCSDAADAGLRVSADAVDAGLMLLMLVVSWPRSACVSNVLALGMLPHVCPSVYVWRKVILVCWVKTCLTYPCLCLAKCSHGGTRTPLIDMLCWIETAPARVVLCNSRSTTMRACSFSFVTMAASVRGNLKLGISEFRCVANPAPARAFVPARGSQVLICFLLRCH